MHTPQETMDIREERQGDAPAICIVHDEAFGGTLESRLVDMLRASGRGVLSLVAVAEGRIVGHVLFSPVTLEPPSPASRWVALGPVGVLPSHQNRGIGSRLVREGLDGCRSLGCDGVVLLGEPDYYARFGFVPASGHGLTSEFGDMPAFQAAELREGALAQIQGCVNFAPEFSEAAADEG